SAYKLTIKSLGNFNIGSIKSNWLLWIFYLTGVVLTVVRQREEIMLFVLCGILYLLYKSPPNG
ncbi:MAG: chromate transporter, partial [Daejeonella sp.]|nr:chromate transporter [Daejeonella sp.]